MIDRHVLRWRPAASGPLDNRGAEGGAWGALRDDAARLLDSRSEHGPTLHRTHVSVHAETNVGRRGPLATRTAPDLPAVSRGARVGSDLDTRHLKAVKDIQAAVSVGTNAASSSSSQASRFHHGCSSPQAEH
jgi:hypothetical protein